MNKKGFTLVEIIVVIAIIALLILVIIPNVFVLLEKNKEKSCNNLVRNIESAAKIYVANNKYNLNIECNTSFLISLQHLIDSGDLKLDSNGVLTNPIDKRVIDVTNEFVAVIYDCSTKTFVYEIPQIKCDSKKEENKNISPWIMITEPKGTIDSPTQTNNGLITVLGSVYDENMETLKLTINGETIELTNKYSFKKDITLTPNETTEIIIKAIDASGKETIETRYVYYNEKDIKQAIYTEDGSLTFISDKRKTKEDTLNGSKIVEVFTDFESIKYNPQNQPLWLKYNKNIKKVSFETEITPKSTSCWFYNMNNLSQIDNLFNLNTNNVTTMSHMFAGCSLLTELDLSSFKTSNVGYMYNMFQNCTNLKKIIFGATFDTSNVKNMTSMFSDCENLVEIITQNEGREYTNKLFFNTSNVDSIASMFQGCSRLTQLDLSAFDTSKVYKMYSMFEGCSALTELDLRTFDTSNVTNMNHMFRGCTELHVIMFGEKFITSKVTTMEDMFRKCEKLTNIKTYIKEDIYDNKLIFNTSNVTNMNYMFNQCSSLKNLDLSEFNTEKLVQTEYMFKGCAELMELNISNFDVEKLIHYTAMFPIDYNLMIYVKNESVKTWIENNFTYLTTDNIIIG